MGWGHTVKSSRHWDIYSNGCRSVLRDLNGHNYVIDCELKAIQRREGVEDIGEGDLAGISKLRRGLENDEGILVHCKQSRQERPRMNPQHLSHGT